MHNIIILNSSFSKLHIVLEMVAISFLISFFICGSGLVRMSDRHTSIRLCIFRSIFSALYNPASILSVILGFVL